MDACLIAVVANASLVRVNFAFNLARCFQTRKLDFAKVARSTVCAFFLIFAQIRDYDMIIMI